MSIFSLISRSLKEAIELPRFLPFFLIYLLFSSVFLLFITPVIKILPSLVSFQFSTREIGIFAASFMTIFIVFLITIFTNLWFSGALVYNIYSKKNFNESLKHSSSVYWQLLAFFLISILFSIIISFFSFIGSILSFLFEIFFFLTLPSLVLSKESFSDAMIRSFNLVKKNFFKTVILWFLLSIITLLFLFSFLFIALIVFSPALADFIPNVPEMGTFQDLSKEQVIQIVGVVLSNYPLVFSVLFLGSLFFSIMNVFTLTARTYYFLDISKGKH